MKRVFILSSHPLFGEGVASLLGQAAGIDLLGRESDTDRALEQIRELRPDVIIVDAGDGVCDASPILMRVLRESCQAKVIGLNLNNNTICVFHEEQRPVRGVNDLVRAIESDDDIQINLQGGNPDSNLLIQETDNSKVGQGGQ